MAKMPDGLTFQLRCLVSSPQVNSKPCANHPEGSAIRQHCAGIIGGDRCVLDLPTSTRCHVACYCRRCDHQWIEPCSAHVAAA